MANTSHFKANYNGIEYLLFANNRGYFVKKQGSKFSKRCSEQQYKNALKYRA